MKKTVNSANLNDADLVCVKCRHAMKAQNLALMGPAVAESHGCTKRNCPLAANSLQNKVPG